MHPAPGSIVVVGAGAVGLSVAYHLARAGARGVTVLERNRIGSGTSWHAAGIIGPLRAGAAATRLARYAAELLPALDAETGQATGYRRTGGLWLAPSEARMLEIAGLGDAAEAFGLTATRLDAEGVRARFPLLRTDDLLGGLWLDEDGQADPVGVCEAYAKGARAHGARIEEGARVVGVDVRGARVCGVTLADGRRIGCEVLVNCAGAWSPVLGELLGRPVPVQAVAHMYVVTEPVPGLPDPCPVVRDADAGIYLKGDAGRLVLGGFEPDARVLDVREGVFDPGFVELPEDWEQFEPFMRAGLHRVPALAEVGIRRFMNGPEGFTPDTRPLLGPVPEVEGLYVAAGFNSLGIVTSAGAGRAVAEWILDGRPAFDLWEVDCARLDDHAATPGYLRERMREAVANQFELHWPLRQPRTARGVRRTPLHEGLARAGAVFGELAGWERPLWFARDDAERVFRHSYGPQWWWPLAAREGAALGDAAVLFDLSPFTKIDVAGPGAGALLGRLCTASPDLPPDRARYTLLLNEAGGIEAEATLLRLGEDRWRLTTGAATRRKDLAWIRRHAREFDAQILDATATEAVLALAGPRSREVLARVTGADLSAEAFPFAAAREIDAGLARVRAVRLSFSGELGFELHAPAEVAAHLHEALLAAGADLGLAHAGMLCLDGARLEKGFPHWGHDLGAHDTPLEAGLAWCVDWSRAERFLGGPALAAARERGPARRRVLLEVPVEGGDPPLLLHDQPVRRDGHIAGLITSAGVGPRTGRALAMAFVECAPGEPLAALAASDWSVASTGSRYPARLLVRAPYDPEGRRMRS